MDSEDNLKLIERSKRFYEECLRAKLEVSHPNEYVVIQPDSGTHFLGKTINEAAARARAAHRAA